MPINRREVVVLVVGRDRHLLLLDKFVELALEGRVLAFESAAFLLEGRFGRGVCILFRSDVSVTERAERVPTSEGKGYRRFHGDMG